MKLIKKILTILLVIMVITGCGTTNTGSTVKEGNNGSYYLNILKNYEVPKKNINNTKDNEEFNKFEEEAFKKIVSTDFMTLNTNLLDYKALGIKKPEVKLFNIKYGDTAYCELYKEILDELLTFDYNSLSYRQQYDFDYMRYDLIEAIAGEYFDIYCQYFNITNDIVGNSMTNLLEYRFTDEESFNDYVTLLNSTESCFNEVLEFTKKQFENGIGLTNEMITNTVSYIDSFTSKVDDNQLIVNFNNRIDEIDLILDRDSLKEKVKNAVINVVIPTLKHVREEILTYKDSTSDEKAALCNINKEYAEFVYLQRTSSNEDLKETFDKLEEFYRKEYFEATLSVSVDEIYNAYIDVYMNGLDVLKMSYEELLNYLKEHMKDTYPDIGDIPYTISKLDPSVAQDNVLAYYVPMPIDNINLNTIKVNPNNLADGTLETYSVLAHEGMPGHLYQFYYYASTNPAKYRMLSTQFGYIEGHTVTSQRKAMEWLGIDNEEIIKLLKYDISYYFFIYTLVDLGVNYFGWTKEDTVKYLSEANLIYDDSEGEGLYDFMVACPGLYASYGIGALNVYRLMDYAKEQLGDKFNIIEFNKQFLKNGPLPFNMLKVSIDEYIEANK